VDTFDEFVAAVEKERKFWFELMSSTTMIPNNPQVAYEVYADELGLEVKHLTSVQKRQAFLDHILGSHTS
jgi:hypothetical protein